MSTLQPALAFGAGGAEPWAAALRGAGRGLFLQAGARTVRMAFDRWMSAPDATDAAALQGLDGPVLDVGCGPGRMVRAALDAGLPALGLDVAPAAVQRCRRLGLPVLRASVFEALPQEGGWGALLLLDGNVGIGGDPRALLARCRDLLRPGGALLVETHEDRDRDVAYLGRLIDGAGRESAAFPWAELGASALLRAADGFVLEAAWTAEGRAFSRLRRV